MFIILTNVALEVISVSVTAPKFFFFFVGGGGGGGREGGGKPAGICGPSPLNRRILGNGIW